MKPHSETVQRALALIRTLAAMTTDGEPSEDVDALHAAISTAQDILETDADLQDPTSALREG